MTHFEFRKFAVLTAFICLTICLGNAKADTLAIRVASSNDDAEENLVTGAMESLTSSDLELGLERVPDDGEGIQLAGVRFVGVGIPPGSIINSASIQFTVDEDDKGPATANFGIFGELSLNAAAFTSDDGNISGRPSTAAAVGWFDVPSWTGQVGTAGPDQLTPDLTDIVQEIIDQVGWAAGNAMAFGIAPITVTGGIDATSEANRTAESFDGVADSAALLQVEWIPEPSAIVLAALGVVATLGFRRRR